jgi:hypothetical protein
VAVVSVNEVLPRTYSHKLGDSPTATRVFKVTISGTVSQQDALNACNISHNAAHPEFTFLKCDSFEVTDADLYHMEVTASYARTPATEQEPGQLPWAEPDNWSFSAISGQVALTTYFPDQNVNNIEVLLTNTADDPYEGLTKSEPLLRATITGYRERFPLAQATIVSTAINNAAFANGGPRTWQCMGVSGTQQFGVFNEQPIDYWQIRTELLYRASRHNIFLPNVGLHYLEDGVKNRKTRCWVVDESGERVPSAGPLALDDNGDLTQIGAGPYPPDVREFRIYPEINFSQYFGNPPASVL